MMIRRALETLSEDELRASLRLMLMQICMLEKEPSSQEAIDGLLELYKDITSSVNRPKEQSISPYATHVHIVTGLSFAGCMKQALKSLGISDTQAVIVLAEDYGMGPLDALDSPKGRQARSEWFRDHILGGADAYSSYEDEYLKVLRQFGQIPEQAQVVIWTAGNATEQIGMRYALHLLGEQPNKVAVYDACSICEHLYNQPTRRFEYRYSGEINPDKLSKAIEQVVNNIQSLPREEIARLRGEWQDISGRSNELRIWLDGQVVEVPADAYDAYLLNKLDKLEGREPGQFIKAPRVIGEAIGYCDQYIGDAYFEYRLRSLVYDGVLEIKGVPTAMRYYSVRRKRRNN